MNINFIALRTRGYKDSAMRVLFPFILFVFSGSLYAQTEAQYQQSLSKLGKEIKQLTKNLNSNRSKLETQQTQLLKLEQELVKIESSIRQARQNIARLNDSIEDIEAGQKQLRQLQSKSRQTLAELIVSHYQHGVPSPLKQVLNQQDPYSVGRLNNYQQYFSEAIQARFVELEQHIQEANQLKLAHKNQISELQSVEQEQEFLKLQQEQQRDKRQQAVKRLDASVSAAESKLKKLQNDRNRLNSLIKKLEEQKAELARIEKERQEAARRAAEKAAREGKKPPPKTVKRTLVKGGFAKQKGRLSCPVSSAPTTKFGQRVVASGMRSEGVFYNTKIGVPVRSIFRGRVLFADFLKGFGLLIIVDHGDDHISLYGHNELLYKKVGDDVAVGEVIGKTGITGGLKSPGLYFEIRNNTTPVNPSKWCQ